MLSLVAFVFRSIQSLLTGRCCTFDAGDYYIPIPANLPLFMPPPTSVYLRTFIGYWLTVIIGRYIGSLLGYYPFFREYTTD